MSNRWSCLLSAFILLVAGCGDENRVREKGAPEEPATLTIDAPMDLTIYPPDLVAPRIQWKDATEGARTWRIELTTEKDLDLVRVHVPGTPPPIGRIDPACIASTNVLPARPGPYERSWTIPEDLWAEIKRRTVETWATLTITGLDPTRPDVALSRGWARFKTSRDPVEAPIFYRDVPLAPARTAKGKIMPLPAGATPLIQWRLRDVSKSESRLLLEGMPTCANCHSFSADGKTFGMDVDGPLGDKGTYAVLEVAKNLVIDYENIFTWNEFPDKPEDHHTLGFLSRVSPDGRYVISTVNEALYVANYTNYEFLQVFYPTRGILAVYDRTTGSMKALPGADDPAYVHCDPVWTPDGKTIVFARAGAREPYTAGRPLAEYPGDPNETPIQYDLHRMAFAEGRGGTPVPIQGASANGMSNTFPKVSPDGRWIVYVKCRNGQLMRPDGRLWIVPLGGGAAREMRCNTWRMNSWHSFSPNGRWMVFSSKGNTPYTQMLLTHIDADGGSSPAVLIPNATAANRAVNIPEFLNASYDALQSISVPGVKHNRRMQQGLLLVKEGQVEGALARFEEAVGTNPKSASAWLNVGWARAHLGQHEEGIRALEKAVALEPSRALAQNKLGFELMRQSKDRETLERALGHIQKAREFEPSLTEALRNEALALFRLERDKEAELAYRELVRRLPEDAVAHGALGTLSLRRRAYREGAGHLKRAVGAAPDDLALLSSLAWLLATAPDASARDGARAVELAERLVELSHRRDALHLDTLAAAYAEAGRFEDAVETAREAEAKAEGTPFGRAIGERRALYSEKRPHRQRR